MNGILLSQDNVFVSSQVFEISTIGNYAYWKSHYWPVGWLCGRYL